MFVFKYVLTFVTLFLNLCDNEWRKKTNLQTQQDFESR